MGNVLISDVTAGMVLATDLLGSGGRMLLPAGVELQDGHLKTLKAWGVTEVDVEESDQGDGGAGPSVSAEQSRQGQEYAASYFALADLGHPAMAEIFRYASTQVAGRLARGAEVPPFPWQDSVIIDAPQLPAGFWQKAPQKPESLFHGTVELASLPDVYSRIVEVMNSPRSSAAQLAEMVSKDTSLSSRLLKLVNSAFYGFPSRIDSITRAVTLIGTNELTTMALGISVVNAFRNVPDGLMSVEGFWRHSIACGVFGRLLGANKVGISTEQLFVGGLLHDIGRMVMLQQMPDFCTEVIRTAHRERLALSSCEKNLLGYEHTEVGRLLCKEWRFSRALEEMISDHHLPGQSRYVLHSCLIHVADIMAKAYFVGHAECGCVMISPLQHKAWEGIGIDPAVLQQVFSQAAGQIDEIIKVFLESDDG